MLSDLRTPARTFRGHRPDLRIFCPEDEGTVVGGVAGRGGPPSMDDEHWVSVGQGLGGLRATGIVGGVNQMTAGWQEAGEIPARSRTVSAE